MVYFSTKHEPRTPRLWRGGFFFWPGKPRMPCRVTELRMIEPTRIILPMAPLPSLLSSHKPRTTWSGTATGWKTGCFAFLSSPSPRATTKRREARRRFSRSSKGDPKSRGGSWPQGRCSSIQARWPKSTRFVNRRRNTHTGGRSLVFRKSPRWRRRNARASRLARFFKTRGKTRWWSWPVRVACFRKQSYLSCQRRLRNEWLSSESATRSTRRSGANHRRRLMFRSGG
mmetsp:Transcript_12364/g.46117  ORF Transcript_12364/g.46117 Transcript_12364/m.46117 type:complete len:228 (+) Transcript_12364:599-1282(+)